MSRRRGQSNRNLTNQLQQMERHFDNKIQNFRQKMRSFSTYMEVFGSTMESFGTTLLTFGSDLQSIVRQDNEELDREVEGRVEPEDNNLASDGLPGAHTGSAERDSEAQGGGTATGDRDGDQDEEEEDNEVVSGLSNSDINRLPTRMYLFHPLNSNAPPNISDPTPEITQENGECHVCWDDYHTGDVLRTLTCFHEFHATCIDGWLSHNATCPICRITVVLDNLGDTATANN